MSPMSNSEARKRHEAARRSAATQKEQEVAAAVRAAFLHAHAQAQHLTGQEHRTVFQRLRRGLLRFLAALPGRKRR